MSLVTVLVADDHGVVRAGLKTLLERSSDIQVIGEASDGREAVKLAEELNPQVVVMDITMPHLNGIDATAQILRRNPQISVIILSMYSDEAFLLRGLNAGIRGYLLKDSA
jgi:DNA-binding NarL/FixJ family response regulator